MKAIFRGMGDRRKFWISIILLIFVSAVFLSAANPNQDAKYDSIVVVKIHDITGDQYLAISEAVAKETDATLEYTCLWSGMVVIKINNTSFSSKGDVYAYVSRMINRGTEVKKLELIHVHTETSGKVTKC